LSGRVAVVGGGRMGAGIAQVFAERGVEVLLADADATLAEAAVARIRDALELADHKGYAVAPAAEAGARLTPIAGHAAIPADIDLVVEAVPELPDLKDAVLGALGAALPAGVLIATNTSSISIATLARTVAHPERFLGMHFFNPVPRSALVEIVEGPDTAPEAVHRATAWVRTIAREPIVVRDAPGFASSRLGVLLGLEAIRMVEQGVASADDIDRAMTLGYGHPMGPLRTTDQVGLDVRLDIATYLERELGERFAPPQLLRDHVAAGRLGRKSGRGFFEWPAG
jgi:3-hydroxybutyryl-CoA dehydrogenase